MKRTFLGHQLLHKLFTCDFHDHGLLYLPEMSTTKDREHCTPAGTSIFSVMPVAGTVYTHMYTDNVKV